MIFGYHFFVDNLFFLSGKFRIFSSYFQSSEISQLHIYGGVCFWVSNISSLVLSGTFQFNDSSWFSVLEIFHIKFCYTHLLPVISFKKFFSVTEVQMTKLYTLKAWNVMIWHTYTLWNNYHTSFTSHSYFFISFVMTVLKSLTAALLSSSISILQTWLPHLWV